MQLKYVDLDNNQLADLTALQVTGGSGPTQLQAVSADYNAISDLSPLNGMTSLAYLSANNLPEAINGLPGPSLQGQYGSGWNQLLASLPSPSGQSNDNFGYCTASVGAYLLVGDPMYTFAGGTQQGAVLVYDKSTGEFPSDPSRSTILRQPVRVGDGGCGGLPHHRRGREFRRRKCLYLQRRKLEFAGNGGRSARYQRRRVWLLAGKCRQSAAGRCAPHSTSSTLAAAGIVYEYSIPAVLAAATPSQLLTITDKHGQANGLFGDALTAVGGQIAIGAPGDNVNSTTGGWAELFDPVTGLWVRDFANPGSTSGFGSSLATSGTTVIIGAPRKPTATSPTPAPSTCTTARPAASSSGSRTQILRCMEISLASPSREWAATCSSVRRSHRMREAAYLFGLAETYCRLSAIRTRPQGTSLATPWPRWAIGSSSALLGPPRVRTYGACRSMMA